MLSIKFAGFSGNRVGLVNVAEEKIITIIKKTIKNNNTLLDESENL